MKYQDMIQQHIEMLYAGYEINESNQIRMFFAKNEIKDGIKREIKFNKFATNREQAYETIIKYKEHFNCFLSLATVKGESGTTENQQQRQVIALDFDKKDFNNVQDLSFYIDLWRDKIGLFYHAIIDTGNGYHFYMMTDTTTDIEGITDLNKLMQEKAGSDAGATLKTQVMRVAGTHNLKDINNSKNVNMVVNNTPKSNFKAYNIVKLAKQFKEPEKLYKSNVRVLHSIKATKMHCVDKMLLGVEQGERNFALGRIIKALQVRGYEQARAQLIVREFNQRCTPPKQDSEIIADFKKFWESDYRLLGCYIQDERKQGILKQYCSLYECEYRKNYNGLEAETAEDQDKYIEIMMSNKFLGGKSMRKLKGNHYLLLAMLLTDKQNGLDTNELIKAITPIRSNNPCIKQDKLYVLLKELEQEGFIRKEISNDRRKPNRYKVIDNPGYTRGYTRVLQSVAMLLINQCITQQQYLIYLYLLRNTQLGITVDYDAMSNELGIPKSNVSRTIKEMQDRRMILIEKRIGERGLRYNYYKFIA